MRLIRFLQQGGYRGACRQIPVPIVTVVFVGMSVGGHSFRFPKSPIIRTYCKFIGSLILAPAPPQSLSHDKVQVKKLYFNCQCVARVTHKLTAGNEKELCFPLLGNVLACRCSAEQLCIAYLPFKTSKQGTMQVEGWPRHGTGQPPDLCSIQKPSGQEIA